MFCYSTVGDSPVRKEHARLDGLTMPAISNAWKGYRPPLDWNCRYTIIPGNQAKLVSDQEDGKLLKDTATNPFFANNQAVEKMIFSKDHPVYKSLQTNKETGKEKELYPTAVRHYGLKPVKEIIKESDGTYEKGVSIEAFNDFWGKLKKVANTDNIVLKDNLKRSVLFDSNPKKDDPRGDKYFFKTHIF